MKLKRWPVIACLLFVLNTTASPVRAAGEAGFVDQLDAPAIPSALAAASPLQGVALAGRRLVAVGQRGHIVYSDDTGHSWIQAKVPVSSDLTAVSFPTERDGWAVGHDGVILATSDRGASWTKQLDGRSLGASLAAYYRSKLEAGDTSVNALVQESERMEREGPQRPFLDVWFRDAKVGYAVGAFNLALETSDGGRHWTPFMEKTQNSGFLHLCLIRPNDGALYIAGEQGLLLRQATPEGRFERIQMKHKGTFFGIVAGSGFLVAYGLGGSIYRSTDSGAIWNPAESPTTAGINAGAVTADGAIVLVTQGGGILVSRDKGRSFQLAKGGDRRSYFGLVALSGNQVALVGPSGVEVKSERSVGISR